MTLETMEPMKGKAKSYEAELTDWISSERAAIELIGHIGTLWFEKSVELIIFRNQLIDRSPSEIMNLHQYAKDIVKRPISVRDTANLAGELAKLDLAPSRIDIGRLCAEWTEEKGNFTDMQAFVTDKLKDYIGAEKGSITPKDIVLYCTASAVSAVLQRASLSHRQAKATSSASARSLPAATAMKRS
jgi:glyceraldehyde 3-phosphate dehydrogenase